MVEFNAEKVDVAIAYCDQLLKDLLEKSLRNADGVTFHGHLAGSALLDELRMLRLDVVILQVREDSESMSETIRLCRSLLEFVPSVTFLALQNHGRTMSVFELNPTSRCIGSATMDGLSDLIRGWRRIGERRVFDIH